MTDQKSERLRDQVDRGERARIVLAELKDAKEALEQQVFDSFRRSDVHDSKGHQAQRFYLRVLDDVFQRFEQFVITGEDARKELVRIKSPSIVQRIRNV